MPEVTLVGVPGCNTECGEGERGERGKRGKRGKRGRRGHDGHDGKHGKDGHDGHDGFTGPTGPGGATGFTGAPGAGAGGAIIPFASGTPVELISQNPIIPVALETCAVIGFGSSAPVEVINGQLNLTGIPPGALLDMAWTMPRDGTLTELSGFYSNIVASGIVPIGGFATVELQIYRAVAPDSNIFVPLSPVLELQPPLNIFSTLGTTAIGTLPLNIAVSKQDRLVLVACVDATGLSDNPVVVSGYISAGLAIA